MTNILNSFINGSNQTFIAIVVLLSGLRVFLEVINKNPAKWPLSKLMAKRVGDQQVEKFHRYGLYLCIGQIILWAPELLFS
jgi:hypothetical protein